MATMNIKDPEVHKLATELARVRQTSATGAVREALREALARERRRPQVLRESIKQIQLRAVSLEGGITADDLYDGDGLPT